MKSFKRSILLILGCLTLCLTSRCQSGAPFQMLESPPEDQALLYLVRPAVSVWSFRDFDIRVFSYSGHFTDSEPKLVESFEIKNNEFRRALLSPGYYRLELAGYSSRIIHVKPGALLFYEVYIFSKGFFHFPDLDIKEITGKRALSEMAGKYPMYERLDPIQCCAKGSEELP